MQKHALGPLSPHLHVRKKYENKIERYIISSMKESNVRSNQGCTLAFKYSTRYQTKVIYRSKCVKLKLVEEIEA